MGEGNQGYSVRYGRPNRFCSQFWPRLPAVLPAPFRNHCSLTRASCGEQGGRVMGEGNQGYSQSLYGMVDP